MEIADFEHSVPSLILTRTVQHAGSLGIRGPRGCVVLKPLSPKRLNRRKNWLIISCFIFCFRKLQGIAAWKRKPRTAEKVPPIEQCPRLWGCCSPWCSWTRSSTSALTGFSSLVHALLWTLPTVPRDTSEWNRWKTAHRGCPARSWGPKWGSWSVLGKELWREWVLGYTCVLLGWPFRIAAWHYVLRAIKIPLAQWCHIWDFIRIIQWKEKS